MCGGVGGEVEGGGEGVKGYVLGKIERTLLAWKKDRPCATLLDDLHFGRAAAH